MCIRDSVRSLVLVIVAVGLAALVAVSINYYFGTPKKTYEGASMSFQYTARWNKVDPDGPQRYGGNGPGVPDAE